MLEKFIYLSEMCILYCLVSLNSIISFIFKITSLLFVNLYRGFSGSQWYNVILNCGPQFYFSPDCPNCTKFSSLKCAHISLWLNPVGHSKFHNTSNHPLPATNSGQTARTPLYPPVQPVPPYSLSPFIFPVPDRGTGEGWYLCP